MEATLTNPLLQTTGTPDYKAIDPAHIKPAVTQRIAEYEALLEQLLAPDGPRTWAGLIAPLAEADEALERAWGPVEHLNSVMNTDALREVYKETKPLLSEFGAKVSQDERLCAAVQAVSDQADAEGLDPVQRRVLELQLRDFKLSGVDLPQAKKTRYCEIQVRTGQLASEFMEHVLDEEKDYRLVIEDPAHVAGLPESLVELARAKAVEDDADAPEQRWTFTLHMPSFRPFMQFQQRRELREQLYRAYVTKASDQSASGKTERDNGPVIDEILTLRAELATLLGFGSFGEVSLARKMATSPEEVVAFLNDLADKALPFGKRDIEELREAARADGVEELAAWDQAYYREKLRKSRYAFSDDEVRQYFPLSKVLTGLFQTLDRIYGISLSETTGSHETWHDDVRVLEVRDAQGLRGHMFLDLFAREGKRQGAWMGECVNRKRTLEGAVQHPVAYLVCNFSPPVGGKPSLLQHSEVVTLFHECGHALHHVLTQVDYPQVAGINEVPWDGVELPSQFHENWTWQPEALGFLSGHAETGESLPQELLDKMLAAKNFQSGADMLRQLEFALFDLELHTGYTPGGEQTVQQVLDRVRERVQPLRAPTWNRFQNAFGHIFAGGYAAGYYSYKWAEVLAADAFSRFEEEGIFSPEAGKAFREHILERGGSDELMELYVQFRGRKPTPDALLRHSGLVGAPA